MTNYFPISGEFSNNTPIFFLSVSIDDSWSRYPSSPNEYSSTAVAIPGLKPVDLCSKRYCGIVVRSFFVFPPCCRQALILTSHSFIFFCNRGCCCCSCLLVSLVSGHSIVFAPIPSSHHTLQSLPPPLFLSVSRQEVVSHQQARASHL